MKFLPKTALTARSETVFATESIPAVRRRAGYPFFTKPAEARVLLMTLSQKKNQPTKLTQQH
jgi:hypothetical protein